MEILEVTVAVGSAEIGSVEVLVIVDIVEVAEQQWSPCYVHLKSTQIPTLMLNLFIHLSYMLNLMTQPDHM